MLIEIHRPWIAVLNCIGIPATHLLIVFWSSRRTLGAFDPTARPFRPSNWENHGKIYDTVLKLRHWKHLLPDGAAWLSGFTKSKLRTTDPAYLRRFILETCRGEQSHWLQLIAISTFIIWTPFPACLVIITYSLFVNIPCIINLRQTRFRLQPLIPRAETRNACSHPRSSPSSAGGKFE